MSNEGIEPAASLPNEIRNLGREYRVTGIMAPLFWGPCLKHCVRYQRVTCYFTSKGLLGWTQALPGLIRGELELIQLVFFQLNYHATKLSKLEKSTHLASQGTAGGFQLPPV